MENLLEIREQVQHEGGEEDDDLGTFKVGQASVIEKDVITDDGVVHFVDSVLVPPASECDDWFCYKFLSVFKNVYLYFNFRNRFKI